MPVRSQKLRTSKRITKSRSNRKSRRKSRKNSKRKSRRTSKRKSRKNSKQSQKNRSKSPRNILHTVGTYNMSFASDLGLDPNRSSVYESEASFLLSNDSGDPRKFWKNSLDNVIYFWKSKTFLKDHKPSFLGLQEINKTSIGSTTGSDAIRQKLKEIDPNISMITEEIDSGKSKPALCCIWDSKKLGQMVKTEISKFNYVPIIERQFTLKLTPDNGRPVLMVYTDKGYLLIVLHAPNNDDLALHNLLDFRKNLNDKIYNFSKNLKLYSDRIFISGDFNDKYDAIQNLHLTLQHQNFTLKYKGTAPKSCCHNWDSSCSESRYTTLTDLPGREGRQTIGTCTVPIDPTTQKPYPLAGSGKRHLMGPEGDIRNYRYYGDKVFGANPLHNITTMKYIDYIRPHISNTSHSEQSDHEMVVCTFLTRLF